MRYFCRFKTIQLLEKCSRNYDYLVFKLQNSVVSKLLLCQWGNYWKGYFRLKLDILKIAHESLSVLLKKKSDFAAVPWRLFHRCQHRNCKNSGHCWSKPLCFLLYVSKLVRFVFIVVSALKIEDKYNNVYTS